VGTHAIIQEPVRFDDHDLVVIGEQHQVGVRERAELLGKGGHPDLLVMSATPIPRSLALTLYSDLNISLIKDMPAGRKPVKTAVRSPKKREEVYTFMDNELTEGGQAFVVYPLVEESESMDLKDAKKGFKRLDKRFDKHTVGLLHGRMDVDDKEKVMQQFIRNEIQILVTTTVIEVGVDIPNAHIMLIEHAERFGLSQLHQLRGRIGRGERTSYCILIPDGKLSDEAKFRLNTMIKSSDGFEIAEADLKLRGPGDFMGTKQSGVPEFNVADIVEDQSILRKTKKLATRILEQDPELTSSEHQNLRKVFEPYFREKSNLFTMA
jgi:ATP-dependent DNA helicase RecG